MKDRLHRIAFTRPVYVQVAGTAERAHRLLAANLSRGGMFIRSESHLGPGTRVTVALEAKGQQRPFAEAEVVWSSERTATSAEGALPGFGVRFVRFLHPRSEDLLDFLIHRKAAHLPLALANQQIGEPAEEARPPRDFMNTPIDELGGSSSSNKNITNPQWSKSLDREAEADAPIAEDGPDLAENWFHQPDTQPASALDAGDAGARVGAAVVLVAFLAVVAGGLLWIIKRDDGVAAQEVAATGEPVEAEEENALDELPVEPAAPAPIAAAPTPAPTPTPTPTPTPAPIALVPPAPIVVAPPAPAPVPVARPLAAPSTPEKRTSLASGAAKSVSLARSGKTTTARLELVRGASIDRVFVLSKPERVVIDLKGPSPKGSTQSKIATAGVDTIRVGARAGGTRLVLDVANATASATVVDGAVRIQFR